MRPNLLLYHWWCWYARGAMLEKVKIAKAAPWVFGEERGEGDERGGGGGDWALRRQQAAAIEAPTTIDQLAMAKPVHSTISPKKFAPETYSNMPPRGIL